MTITEPTLFDAPLARTTDPITSHEAGSNPANRFRWNSHKRWLLQAFCDGDAMTYEAAGEIVGLDNVRSTRRCSELKALGLIRHDGTFGTTSTDSRALRYRITDAGVEVLRASKADQ